MATHYLESRLRIRNAVPNITADIMRHLQARQYLGKAIVVCDQPKTLLPLARKQWLKLSRTLQRRRGFTTNAVEILKYTYTITQMQHMQLVAAAPVEDPEATAFLVQPKQLRMVPGNALSVYLTASMPEGALSRLVSGLPNSSLVVDYTGQVTAGDFGLKPKAGLEARVSAEWKTVEEFLASYEIDMRDILRNSRSLMQPDALDDALDLLLGVDEDFLAVASTFQRTLDLARPLQGVSKAQRDMYEAFVLLAHRVQTLSPSGFSAQFLRTYGDDTFYLRDVQRAHESLAATVMRHQVAGRMRLARALMQFTQAPDLGKYRFTNLAGVGA